MQPTLSPWRESSRLSIAVPEQMPATIAGKLASGVESHWLSASRAEAMKPIDSSSGVVCALPTTNEPRSSTMNVSVIVPPASIASTRGICAPFSDIQPPHLIRSIEATRRDLLSAGGATRRGRRSDAGGVCGGELGDELLQPGPDQVNEPIGQI